MLHKAANRIRDLTHKTTRKIANAFPGATCYVGKPFNDAAHKMGRKQAQQVSSACNARLTAQLDYKSAGAREVDEAYTSQTCPVWGTRQRAAGVSVSRMWVHSPTRCDRQHEYSYCRGVWKTPNGLCCTEQRPLCLSLQVSWVAPR